MNLKIKYLREQLKALNIQGMIISNPINIRYLTNICAEGTLLITRKENIYITDPRYIEEVNTALTIDDDVIVYDIRGISKDDYENFFMFCENVGFEEKYITYETYGKLQHMYKCNNLTETEGIIENQRIIKDEEEIEKIKKACEITDKCFSYLLKYIRKGMTEKEIALQIERHMKLNGAESLAFETIVASGPNSSKPHARPTDRKIQSNDVILIDMGCNYNGYCSDMTRTIFVDSIPESIKPMYNLVLKNQEYTLRDIKEGANIKTLSRAVENDFELNNQMIMHALGHGIGLEDHEQPFITTKNTQILKENMVLAIEPGAYEFGKYGVRIEDTILITKTGCINLTKSEKNYTII